MKGSKGTVDSLIRHFSELELTSVVEAMQNLNQDGQETTTGIWFGVDFPTESFTGREQELTDLHALLTRSTEKPTVINQISTVSGLGGIGKSELARKYAWEYCEHYKGNAIWIDAETQSSFRNSVTKFLKLHLQISEDESKEKKDIELVKFIYDGFTSQKCLIIFDNVEEFDVMKLLPKSLNPKAQIPTVLITSRISDWGLGVQVLHLDVLSKEAAVCFVKANVSNAEKEEESVSELVETLQYLPLTLQQAVAYIRAELKLNVSPIRTYLELFKRNEIVILSYTGDEQLSVNEKTTLGTWKTTLMIIQKREFGELAIRIMEIISWFDAERIPIRWFQKLKLARPDAKWYTKILNIFRKTNNEMKYIEVDKRSVEAAVSLLHKYSMVSGSGGVINVHRLVQYVVRSEINQKMKILSEAFELFDNYNYVEVPLTHGVSLWRHALEFEVIIKRYSSFPLSHLFSIVGTWKSEGMLKLARDSKGRMEMVLGFMHEDVLMIKYIEADALFWLKFYSESLELSQELYSTCKVAVGSKHPLTHDVFCLLAQNLQKLGRHCEELKICDELLAILLKEFWPPIVYTIETRRMKGLALIRLGRYDEALEVLQKDEEWNIEEIAKILEEKGNWSEAVEYYRICIKTPGWLLRQHNRTTLETAIKRCEEKLREHHQPID